MADDYFEEFIHAERAAAAQDLFPAAGDGTPGWGGGWTFAPALRSCSAPAPLPRPFPGERVPGGHGPRQRERGMTQHGCATHRAHSRLLFSCSGRYRTIPLRRASRVPRGGRHLLALSHYLEVSLPEHHLPHRRASA